MNKSIIERSNTSKCSVEELNLIDDFLFQEVVSDELDGEFVCRYILNTIIGTEVERVKIVSQKIITTGGINDKSIRLDVYLETIDSDKLDANIQSRECIRNRNLATNNDSRPCNQATIYDLEMQKDNTLELPQRSRYYQALADSRMLKAGISYKYLGDLWIIIITPMDLFGRNRAMYTFEQQCNEILGLKLNDGARRLFVNCSGKEGTNEALRELLDYIIDSTAFNAQSKDLRRLHQIVTRIKRKEEVGIRYMKAFEYEEMIREKAVSEGWEKGMARGMTQGRELGLEQGRELGLEQGESRFSILTKKMLFESKIDELIKAADDRELRNRLYKEYNIL